MKSCVSRKVFRGIGWDLADLKFDLRKSGKVRLFWHRTWLFLRSRTLAATCQTQKGQERGG